MERGPVDVLVLSFPIGVSTAEMVEAIRGPVEAGVVRVIDLVLLARDDQGNLVGIDAEEGLSAEFDGLRIDAHTLLSDDDLEVVAEALGEDEQALVVVIENVWAAAAAEKVRTAGGEFVAQVRIPFDEVEAAFAAQD